MKQIITILLCILLIIPTFSIASNAQEETVVTYIGNSKGRIDCIQTKQIVDMTSIDTEYEITQLAPELMSYSEAEKIILPEHLDYIPTQAFLGCGNITEITVPETVTKIDDYAFAECEKLSSITISQLVTTIGKDILDGCSGDLTVKVYSNSEIYKYCTENGINVEIIDKACTHQSKKTETIIEATCTESGISAEKCRSCGYITKQAEIPANGHKLGTWKLNGNNREAVCTICKTVLYAFTQANPTTPFTDIEKNSWYERSAVFCYANNLMAGTSNTQFSPDVTTTRAMMVKILASYCGANLTRYKHSRFPDVPDGEWYTAAVCWAQENGIVTGFEDNTFRAKEPLTREQLLCIIKNFAGFCGYDTTDRADISAYEDADTVSGWAYDSIRFSIANNLISGTDPTHITPNGNATRAQISQIINNFARFYEPAKYDRVVIIALDGAGNYIKDAKTKSIDRIFKSYTAKTENETDCMSSFNSILTGTNAYNGIISGYGVEYLNSERNYGAKSIFETLSYSLPDVRSASYCANGKINNYIIENKSNIYKQNSDGYDEELCNALCDTNGYLENNDPALLFVHFTQIERAAEHFDGYGENDYLTQIELTDAYVGKIYDKYVSLGRADRTLFLLVCDSAGPKGTKKHYTEANDVFFGIDINSANGKFSGDLKITDTAGIVLKALGAETGDLIKRIPECLAN